jgi:hypothetical protein
MGQEWVKRGLLAGAFVDVEDLITVVDNVLHSGAAVAIPSVAVVPRPTG